MKVLVCFLLIATTCGAQPYTLVPSRPMGANATDPIAAGRELFTRTWTAQDIRARGGDGLGPVYNAVSCVSCHDQGGVGGGGDSNIEILTAVPITQDSFLDTEQVIRSGLPYRFDRRGRAWIGYDEGSLDAHIDNLNKGVSPRLGASPVIDLAAIHGGLGERASVILHKFGVDPAYADWRAWVLGRHEFTSLRLSKRQSISLLGDGLIDNLPDWVIEAGERRRFPYSPLVTGRVSRLGDQIGRFGWKAQIASLEDFTLNAATLELGLETPRFHQGADPRLRELAKPAPGWDLDHSESESLTMFIRSLPAPASDLSRKASQPESDGDTPDVIMVRDGYRVFTGIGCHTCHVPSLGDVSGIYSDLLLHDMGETLADISNYGVYRGARLSSPPASTATTREWRTPPLWGVRATPPYLHDGRAPTIEEAILAHQGEASDSTILFQRLSRADRSRLMVFLLSR